MGLSISIGVLADSIDDPEDVDWFREEIAQVNQVLSEQGLPQHQEPETLPPMPEDRSIWGRASLSYAWIHHLRRIYARIIDDPNWIPIPTPRDESAADDEVVEDLTYMFDSHLLCHSDSEGFYLPIEFDEIIIDDKKQDRIPGGLLGSSYRLMEELILIAPKLGIQLDNGHLSDAEVVKIDIEIENDREAEEGLWIEKIVWLSLFEAARLSIEHKTAICFS
jgi:hypothetical protein